MKKKLLVSFSGGETSAYMAQWLWNNKQDEYDMIFVFANTGQENEQTLEFIQQCEKHFGFPVVWVESSPYYELRKGSGYIKTDFEMASRNGEPFENVIKKYGIPNMSFPHCTRELKENPIKTYARGLGWGTDYYLAIGIRIDEIDRMNPKRKEKKIIYPLVSEIKMTKPKINFWWSQQPFRLNLKGYEGNCKTCWKKSDKKLFQIAKENPSAFKFMETMEFRYDQFVPKGVLKKMELDGRKTNLPVRFFRKNRSVSDIIEASKLPQREVVDDSQIMDETESCELFTEC